jgi:type VI secretion system protein ImpA
VALLQVEGLQGFANGLALLADWTKNHWDGLYPSLDPDDRNDPTERINLLQALSSQDVTGERILQRLANIPLAESPQLGRYSLKTILDSPGKPEIDAAFRDTDKQKLQLAHDAAGHAIAGLKMMQQTLMERVGPERSPNLRELDATLKQIQSRLAPYLSDGAAPGNSAEAAPSTSSTDTAQRSGSAPGTIASREDVVRALRAICAYYKSHEPASPIPLLLGRAERLVNKEFIDIITDLAPESMAQINLISGIRPDANK